MKAWAPPTKGWYILPKPESSGLVALGGDYSVKSLVWAYSQGLFPWFKSQGIIHWFSPNPRFIITPDDFKVPKSLRPLQNSDELTNTIDREFEMVMKKCSESPRPEQEGTWILPEMILSYTQLHKAGMAACCETWRGNELVGGLYGVKLGRNFSGESMFTIETNASKLAFAYFAQNFFSSGGSIIDCQVHSPLFQQFGARLIPRKKFEILWKSGLE